MRKRVEKRGTERGREGAGTEIGEWRKGGIPDCGRGRDRN